MYIQSASRDQVAQSSAPKGPADLMLDLLVPSDPTEDVDVESTDERAL